MNLNSYIVIKICLIISCSLIKCCLANKYNVSFAQIGTCKEYDIQRTGYVYKDFFMVHSLDNNNIASDERLHLKFYVLTAKDAHILLSVTDQPRAMDRVYEIVIGAGDNSFSTIRTSMARRRVVTNQDPQILSMFDPTPIEVIQTKEGHVLVFIPGFKEQPLLNFTDSSPLGINYISFSSFGNTLAKWFYDCEFDGFGNEIEQEIRPSTPKQRLIDDIGKKSFNRTIPDELETIDFAFQILAVSYKQDSSILNTRMNLLMYWYDSKLSWDPDNYDSIATIVNPTLRLWTPNVILLNDAKPLQKKHSEEIRLHANGSVALLAKNWEITTWCNNQANNWPSEQLRCELIIGVNELMPHGTKQLQLVYDNTNPLSNEPLSTLSEWTFKKIMVSRMTAEIANNSISINSHSSIDRYTKHGIIQTMDGDVCIELTIFRNGAFYKNVFMMPLLTCQTLIILSFFLRGYRRGGLILLVFIVMSLGMMFMTKYAPPSYIPSLMLAYQHMMRIATTCYILHIIIIWFDLYPPRAKPWNWIMSAVNSTVLRLALCMRFADANDFVSVQERPWHNIAKIWNNLCFIIVNILFLLINVLLISNV